MSLDTSVTFLIVNMLEDPGSVPDIGNDFFYSTTSRTTLEPNQPCTQRSQASVSSGLKWPERQADYSLSCNEESKKLEALLPLALRSFM